MLNKKEQDQILVLLKTKHNKKISRLLTPKEFERVHRFFKSMIFLPVFVSISIMLSSKSESLWIKSIVPICLLLLFLFMTRYIKKMSNYRYFNEIVESDDPELVFNWQGDDLTSSIRKDIKDFIIRYRLLKIEL